MERIELLTQEAEPNEDLKREMAMKEAVKTSDGNCTENNHAHDCGCADFVEGALYGYNLLKEENERLKEALQQMTKAGGSWGSNDFREAAAEALEETKQIEDERKKA